MISVITPVYNGERFIEACIQVVIDQQCSDVEHIIMDGGSKDGTVDIIKRYAEQYSHIRWLSEKDQGQSDAMNKGIAMAKGEILAILNVDDYYEPNVLKRVTEIFKILPEPSLLVGNCNIWDSNGFKGLNEPRKLKFTDLLLGRRINPYPLNPSAYFYHISLHQVAGLYDVNEHYAMDYDFLFRAVQVANLKYVDETWGNFRVIQGTKTFSDNLAGQGALRVRRLIRTYRKNLPWFQRLKVTIIFELDRILDQVSYFLKHPQEFVPKLQAKFSHLRT
jgi:glycosyltransferase involved in cell wall biosynthesis